MSVVYSREAYEAAAQRLKSTPELLNAADIAQLQLIDPELAERAMLARSQALPPPSGPVPRLNVDEIADAVIDVITKAVTPLAARIAALESRPHVKYHGVHREDTAYQEGALVTRQGGMWCATRTTRDTPGTDGSGWQLVVKQGKA